MEKINNGCWWASCFTPSLTPRSVLRFICSHPCLPLLPDELREDESVVAGAILLTPSFPCPPDSLAPLWQFHPPTLPPAVSAPHHSLCSCTFTSHCCNTHNLSQHLLITCKSAFPKIGLSTTNKPLNSIILESPYSIKNTENRAKELYNYQSVDKILIKL